MPDACHRRQPLQFFRAIPCRVTKCLAFLDAAQDALAEQTIHRRKDRAVSLPDCAVLYNLAHRGVSTRPYRMMHLLLQRPKWRGEREIFEDGIRRRHFRSQPQKQPTTLQTKRTTEKRTLRSPGRRVNQQSQISSTVNNPVQPASSPQQIRSTIAFNPQW